MIQDRLDRFRTMVELAPVAMALFSGPQFVITQVNQRVLTYWGRTRQEVIDKPLFEALPQARHQGYEKLLQGVYTTGERFVSTELPVLLERQGQIERTYIDFVYEPYWDENDTITGVIVICVEITHQVLARQKIQESEERYRLLAAKLDGQVHQRTRDLDARNSELAALNAQLTESNQQLVRSNEALQAFASVASHDLQEPLRKILQFGELLKTQYGDALGDGMDYLNRMQLAAHRMSMLIGDLLNYARLSTYRETTSSVSLQEIVGNVLTDLELIIAETGARITVDSLPSVLGDVSQLGQLFQNLLTNALKFSRVDRSGRLAVPQINIDWERVEAEDLPPSVKPTRLVASYHRLSIVDNGIGFDPGQCWRIFEVFHRLHGMQEFSGNGLGLAICQQVVANHGGAITATSQPGQGATFSVYLPG